MILHSYFAFGHDRWNNTDRQNMVMMVLFSPPAKGELHKQETTPCCHLRIIIRARNIVEGVAIVECL